MKLLNQSLLSKLVGYFFLLSGVTVGLVSFTVNIRARESLQQSVFERLQVATSLKAHQVNKWAETQRRETLATASNLTVRTQAAILVDPNATEAQKSQAQEIINQELTQILALKPEIDRISLLTTAGIIIYSTDPTTIGNYQPLGNTTTYFESIESGDRVRPNFYTSTKTGRPMVTLASPVFSPRSSTSATLDIPESDNIIAIQTLLANGGFYNGSIDNIWGVETETAIQDAQNAYGLPVTGQPDRATLQQLVQSTNNINLTPENQRIAVIAIDLNLNSIDEIIRKRAGLGNSGETYLVGRLESQSALISSHQIGEEKLIQAVSSPGIDAALRGETGEGIYRNYDGIPVIGVYTWLEEQNLALIAEMEQKEAFAPANRLAKDILLLGLTSISLLLIAVYLLTRKITQPILAITETALKVSDGNFDCQAPVLTQDEIGILARTFNQMITDIKEFNQQLSDANKYLEERVKMATVELQETLANLTSIIDHIADGLLVTDAEGKITRTNPALANLFALGDLDIRGKLCSEAFSGDVLNLLLQSKAQPLDAFQGEVKLEGDRIGQAVAKGVLKQVSSPSGSEELIYIGSVVLFRDITAEKEIDRMKTDFISTVSHELRTPLTSVLGFAKLIQKKLDDVILPFIKTDDTKINRAVNQVASNVDIIVSEGIRLTNLINDVLDIAKMEAGKTEWHIEPLSIKTVVERAISATTSLFNNKPIKLIVNMPDNLPDIMGDNDKLMQVFINLISNAVKFTETGNVTLKLMAVKSAIKVSVKDTGCGIDAADREQVFEKFKQVGNTLTNKPQGTGLGLPICQEIIQHHGGSIWVESQVGVGSTFYFTLPLPDDQDIQNAVKTLDLQSLINHLTNEKHQDNQSIGEHKKTILIVDDDPSIRELLRQELDAEGYNVRLAKDGREAISQIKQNPPDLVILDIIMPEINGFDVAAILKHDPETQHIPILVVSADDSVSRGYQVGVDKYLTKPVAQETLLQEVKSLFARGESPKRVLIVDRDISTLEILNEVLKTQGYIVSQTQTQEEFLPQIRAIKPDLVIANAEFSKKYNLVSSLKFEKELANIFLFLLEDSCGNHED
ncbi:response regulator [Arthrospira platensis]|uniref:histidine kinase n=1 Tax=Limnospira platensis NIES-46 TaxID=1236695 RepID=A0A5M3T5W3_LIMPL|nr:response regulator [Arthrospira platensis]AMW28251.1 transcriptional regulator [Arthrospira platensis YZ]KDR55662.1 transcriptional regulator [Arthrospira platensis str. Paraca]MBD2671167.1 response regulator [Arthrospira platensis FACHB-439]MBD2711967.1 response regulator [Arthrospira platensis FACHB-835]MDF2209404.1 response regulator [Arthrospira platensis NCB002]MDT9184567.1 response regulator [Limnospira sp. PMC 289.06]MDT9296733.1 response regulator [Arthrospira platensis PCC 7345]